MSSRTKSGFTIIELLVGISVLSLVGLAVSGLAIQLSRLPRVQEPRGQAITTSRVYLERLGDAIRLAQEPEDTDSWVKAATASELNFWADTDNDGTPNDVLISLADGLLTVSVDGTRTAQIPVANEDVTPPLPLFTYYTLSGPRGESEPLPLTNPDPAQPTLIQRVRLSLAVDPNSDRDHNPTTGPIPEQVTTVVTPRSATGAISLAGPILPLPSPASTATPTATATATPAATTTPAATATPVPTPTLTPTPEPCPWWMRLLGRCPSITPTPRPLPTFSPLPSTAPSTAPSPTPSGGSGGGSSGGEDIIANITIWTEWNSWVNRYLSNGEVVNQHVPGRIENSQYEVWEANDLSYQQEVDGKLIGSIGRTKARDFIRVEFPKAHEWTRPHRFMLVLIGDGGTRDIAPSAYRPAPTTGRLGDDATIGGAPFPKDFELSDIYLSSTNIRPEAVPVAEYIIFTLQPGQSVFEANLSIVDDSLKEYFESMALKVFVDGGDELYRNPLIDGTYWRYETASLGGRSGFIIRDNDCTRPLPGEETYYAGPVSHTCDRYPQDPDEAYAEWQSRQ